MKKTLPFILICILLVLALTGCSTNNENQHENPSENMNTQRLNAEIATENNVNTENTITNEIRIGAHEADANDEMELASFSTKLSGKNTARSRNIGITTSTLNETIVKNGETFSFCNTVGKPTSDKGYEEADSFDKDGNTVKTLGGRKLSSK